MKIILAGGRGFLGKTLAKFFYKKGYEIVIFSREEFKSSYAKVVTWDAENLESNWTDELEDSYAIINLVGRSVNCRYTAKNKELIINSRVLSTKVIGKAIQTCKNPPKVWINSSSATIYKHNFQKVHNEDSQSFNTTKEAKDAFSVKVIKKWEEAFDKFKLEKTRKITLRITMVFGSEKGGVFHTLKNITKLGLGGQVGNGKQMVSWIMDKDFCEILDLFLNDKECKGIYNMASPNPIKNKDMMALFRKNFALIPINIPAPLWLIEIGCFFMRTESELVIKSRNVISKRLEEHGYQFKFDTMKKTLEYLKTTNSL